LTPFKRVSEYVICLVLLGSLALLVRNRDRFERPVLFWLAGAIVATVAGELFFTLYISVYGLYNLMGHLFKIVSFYFIYRAIIYTGLTRPHALLWRDLKSSEERWRQERDRAQGYLDVAGVMMVVLGPDRKVRLINEAGCKMLGRKAEEILGRDWVEHFVPQRAQEEVATVFSRLISGEIASVEYFENPVLDGRGRERIIAFHNALLRDREGKIQGTLSSGEDITERKTAEEERERLLRELQDALSQVKVLRGMLPICSSCKKIRDDKGYWTQIEAYIREHSDLEFTHGICPDCRRRLYPEFSEMDHGTPQWRHGQDQGGEGPGGGR